MTVLRIEHATTDYDGWKQMFDSDPIDRKGSGVRRHEIFRGAKEPDFVSIDLEFGTVAEAESFLVKLREVWEGPAKAILRNPQGRILESAETAVN